MRQNSALFIAIAGYALVTPHPEIALYCIPSTCGIALVCHIQPSLMFGLGELCTRLKFCIRHGFLVEGHLHIYSGLTQARPQFYFSYASVLDLNHLLTMMVTIVRATAGDFGAGFVFGEGAVFGSAIGDASLGQGCVLQEHSEDICNRRQDAYSSNSHGLDLE